MELELWAHELRYSISVLGALYTQKEAINLRRNVEDEIVENYEPYVGLENSVCMKK